MKRLLLLVLALAACGGPISSSPSAILCNFTGGIGMTFPPDVVEACFRSAPPDSP